MRILIVDDEASIRKTTAIAVQTTGHEAVEASSGARALKLVETEGFDVCFLDVKLGAEDGLVVMDKLLQVSPGLAVVMFTAFASIATAVEAMRRGAFDFIPKPFTPEQIRQVLQKIVRTRSLEQRVRQLESQLADESPEIDLTSARTRRAARARDGLQGRRHHRDDPHPGSERHRQERARPRNPPPQRAARAALCHGQLPEPFEGIAGERTLRPCERRVHRRRAGHLRQGRRRRGRHAVPRRDRGDAARNPAQAPAPVAGPRV